MCCLGVGLVCLVMISSTSVVELIDDECYDRSFYKLKEGYKLTFWELYKLSLIDKCEKIKVLLVPHKLCMEYISRDWVNSSRYEGMEYVMSYSLPFDEDDIDYHHICSELKRVYNTPYYHVAGISRNNVNILEEEG